MSIHLKRFFLSLPLFTIVSATALWGAQKQKIIIDDDGLGLMHVMLLKSDAVEVVGITSVTGNSWSKKVVADNLRALELLDRTDIPVAMGASYPLINTEKETLRWESIYGKLTWKGVWMREWVEHTTQTLPDYFSADDAIELEAGNPTTEAIPESAASFMLRMVKQFPGEIIILATGPLTNLALAQRIDPSFATLAKELIYMGGSFNPRQTLDNQVASEFAREFVNTPRREFNIRFDPEAAKIVSRSPWKKITVIPADPSTDTQITPELLDQIRPSVPEGLTKIIDNFAPGFPMWDEIAAAILIDPAIAMSKKTLFVDYNTQFSAGYGDTLSWTPGYEPELGEQLADVVLQIDAEMLNKMLIDVIGE